MTTTGDMPPRQPEDDEPVDQLFGEVFTLVDETVARITDAEVDEHLRRALNQSGHGGQLTDPPHRYTKGVTLTAELFDAIEVNAARTGNHKRAAVRMSRLAVQAQPGGMTRAEAHRRAGEQWLLADDPAEAVHQFRRAIAGTGPTSDDPRVPLARAMFALGGVADADALLRELRESGGKTLPRTCDLVAELLIEQGDLEGALDWATAGIDACMRGDDRGELQLLLRLRYRIRGDLGLPEDDYDKMLAQGEPSSSVGYLPGAG